jgi:hypothetical protein
MGQGMGAMDQDMGTMVSAGNGTMGQYREKWVRAWEHNESGHGSTICQSRCFPYQFQKAA